MLTQRRSLCAQENFGVLVDQQRVASFTVSFTATLQGAWTQTRCSSFRTKDRGCCVVWNQRLSPAAQHSAPPLLLWRIHWLTVVCQRIPSKLRKLHRYHCFLFFPDFPDATGSSLFAISDRNVFSQSTELAWEKATNAWKYLKRNREETWGISAVGHSFSSTVRYCFMWIAERTKVRRHGVKQVSIVL